MRRLKITDTKTDRSSMSMNIYLSEIATKPLITAEEEVRLAELVRQGSTKAVSQLAYANLRFVVTVAKQYQNQGMLLPDLVNEGNIGLLKAISRFDETRGFKLISYAVWWIRQSIMLALSEQVRIIRLPANKVGYVKKINNMFAGLEQEFEREPTHEEIARALNITVEDIREIMNPSRKHISMDAPLYNGEDPTLMMFLHSAEDAAVEVALVKESMKKEITRALSTLTPREKDVIIMYFGIEHEPRMTLEEIGEYFELTRERVRQIKNKALVKLKHTSRNKHLKAYVC